MFEFTLKQLKSKKGFTLVELVVVIAILGILAGIAVPKLSKSRENAAITAHNANVRTLESVATMYIADGGGNTTWKSENDTGDNGWSNYIQEWPELPDLLKNKTGISAADGTTEIPMNTGYEVEIKDGTIAVTPVKISKLK